MPDFGRIINLGYMRILGRPADPGGQENFDRPMNQGMTEAMMRENPDRPAQPTRTSVKASSSTRKKSKAKRRKKKTKTGRKSR